MAKNMQAANEKKALLKLINKYYGDMAEFQRQKVMFEMGTRHAFHSLLAEAGKPHRWTLIAEQEKKFNGKTIRPDGTFKDEMNLVRGYWEAKDTADKLDAEIEKKRKAGYPFNNMIFEDTETAVLYQHGQRVLSVKMNDPDKLAELVMQFFRYVEPEIEEFEQAIEEFKERVPDLAAGLKKKIEEAHRANPAFKRAFAEFFDLCRTSLNPNLSQAAVDEMLIQHILTERLIREIFDNPEFVRRNVIAAEVEKVMLAMTSQSFDRNTYLRELDRFDVAIEHAARTMTDFSDKQHFLNTVYERFFQGYSVKLADTMGIVYTPQAIVDFMCASVAEVLETEFGKTLWSEDVYIIDPCTGTGNFIVNLIRRIPKTKLEAVYRHRLFANEIMLLPYYIAALNIEHAYFEQMGRYESFEGLCFVDTLDMADHPQTEMGFMTERNTERVERQRQAPITVVIGNPPYNVGQENENDNNKNGRYPEIDKRVRDSYVADSSATLKNKLYDPYVRFFRWATDRLGGRDGIVCFVSNNNFVDSPTFDGMRKHFSRNFAKLYHVDLHGNVRQNPKLSGTTHNVFGIQVGVGITVAVRKSSADSSEIGYVRLPGDWRKEAKLEWLAKAKAVSHVEWKRPLVDGNGYWRFGAATTASFAQWIPLGSKAGKSNTSAEPSVIFRSYCPGVNTGRDATVYGYSREQLSRYVNEIVERYNAEVDRFRRKQGIKNLDNFLDYTHVKWSEALKLRLKRYTYAEFREQRIRAALYRPYTNIYIYYDDVLNDRPALFDRYFPFAQADDANRVIVVSDRAFRAAAASVLIAKSVVDYHLCATTDAHQTFPFYIYDADGANRRENITDWALRQFREHYKNKKIDKWAIFHYLYGLLHHCGYREKFADNLKRELPRIPFAPDFRAFAKAGKKLADLHLDYESLEPWNLQFIEAPGVPLSYRVEDKMRLSKDKLRLIVNPSLTLGRIPPAALEYRLGNRSALEWVVDQYQISTDKRSGVISDPNRDGDPEYIVRLIGQVVRVSLETVKTVESLPPYSADDA